MPVAFAGDDKNAAFHKVADHSEGHAVVHVGDNGRHAQLLSGRGDVMNSIPQTGDYTTFSFVRRAPVRSEKPHLTSQIEKKNGSKKIQPEDALPAVTKPYLNENIMLGSLLCNSNPSFSANA